MNTNQTTPVVTLPGLRRGRTPDARAPERERAVLDVAEKLFILHGYHHVSIATIACTVRVATKTIYAKFGNKRGMLRAIVERNLRTWRQQITAIERSGADVRGQLDALACLMLRRMLSMPDARLRADAAAERDEELAVLVAAADGPYRQSLVRLLACLPACRQATGPDVNVLADMFIGCVLGPHIGVIAGGVLQNADPDRLRHMAELRVAAFLTWAGSHSGPTIISETR